MKNKRNLLIVSILTVIIAILWLLSSAFKVSSKSTLTPELERIITPLDPTLDMAVFDDLQQAERSEP